jgi:lipid A disaccharide synthetase
MELRRTSFTSIYSRIRKLTPEIENNNSDVMIPIDPIAFKTTLSEKYFRNKRHKGRKEWMKFHVVINKRTLK